MGAALFSYRPGPSTKDSARVSHLSGRQIEKAARIRLRCRSSALGDLASGLGRVSGIFSLGDSAADCRSRWPNRTSCGCTGNLVGESGKHSLPSLFRRTLFVSWPRHLSACKYFPSSLAHSIIIGLKCLSVNECGCVMKTSSALASLRQHWPFAIVALIGAVFVFTNLQRDYLWEDEGDTAVL